MNSDMQRILDKATELLDMMTAVQNKWATQGKAAQVRALMEAETTIHAALNRAAHPVDLREFYSTPFAVPGPSEFKDEQSPDKPDAPKRGKK